MSVSVSIHNNSRIPKYLQLAAKLVEWIKSKNFLIEEQLPSINDLSARLGLSRDTVEKAYKELRKRNLVEAIPGKGHFVKQIATCQKSKVLLLFNKLSAHKKIIYDSFMTVLSQQMEVDFCVYNNDFRMFEHILKKNENTCAYYVIIPHFFEKYHCAKDIIDKIPKHKLILLDKRIEGIKGNYACIYQDFEQNIYDALSQSRDLLMKYDSLKLIFPAITYQPREIVKGFQRFCIEHNFQGKIVPDIKKEVLAKKDCYITMMEDDLVCLVKKIKESGLIVGQEVGILSYNENPLKEVLLDGISVISTDFKLLGETAARMILENRKGFIENPFQLIIRKSL